MLLEQFAFTWILFNVREGADLVYILDIIYCERGADLVYPGYYFKVRKKANWGRQASTDKKIDTPAETRQASIQKDKIIDRADTRQKTLDRQIGARNANRFLDIKTERLARTHACRHIHKHTPFHFSTFATILNKMLLWWPVIEKEIEVTRHNEMGGEGREWVGRGDGRKRWRGKKKWERESARDVSMLSMRKKNIKRLSVN